MYISILFFTFYNIYMLSLSLDPIFKARGIERPYTFLVKAGLAPHTAHILLNSKTRTFRLDHIEILCRILICEPNDLLLYTPDPNHILTPDHPLNNILPTEIGSDLKGTLSTMPYKQLKIITKQINTDPEE